MSEQTIEKPTTSHVDGEERDRMSHYAKKEDIDKSWLTGEPVTALCGKKWVPTRDPEKYPVCPTCKDIYDNVVGSNLPPEERD